MQLAFLYLNRASKLSSASDYINYYPDIHKRYIQLSENSGISITVIQRADIQEAHTLDNITYHFTTDGYDSTLRWWQEPISSFESLLEIKPDIVEIAGLALPLNFRWLRRITNENVKIIGRHTGEDIWAQRNLWLQQFGLRVVDGFIFQKKSHIESWIRASVILPRQALFILNSYGVKDESETEKLQRIYYEMAHISGKDEDTSS